MVDYEDFGGNPSIQRLHCLTDGSILATNPGRVRIPE
jgi:hypothetical protein